MSFLRYKLLLLFLILSVSLIFAQDIRVRGTVRNQHGVPQSGIMIYDVDDPENKSSTDEDGRFNIFVSRKGSLSFESIFIETLVVKVNGKQTLDVVVEEKVEQLDEVIITGKAPFIEPEKAEVLVRGNYLIIPTRIPIQKSLFKSNYRLMIQPWCVNVMKRTKEMLTPMVLEGEQYRIAQTRMYGYDYSKDPVSPYASVQDPGDGILYVPYLDSIYQKDPNQDFRFDFLLSTEDYNKIIKVPMDSFVIARGTSNPMRFFQYELDAMSITDGPHIPKPEPQLCDDKDEVRLTFKPGVSKIDLSLGDNAVEIEKARTTLLKYMNNPDATLKSFEVNGVSSPDGSYQRNVQLAKERLSNASSSIISVIPASIKSDMEIKNESKVEDWETIAKMMEADSLTEEAAQIRAIIEKNAKNIDGQFLAISRLKYYRPVIVEKYLHRLRKVEYSVGYSVYRVLTDDEIRNWYKSGNHNEFTRYEFFRMMQQAKDTTEMREICTLALQRYPRFMLAANELSMINIKNNCPDPDLLKPFVDRKAPYQILANQTLTLLKSGLYTKADSVRRLMPEDEPTLEEMKSIVRLLNGDYSNATAILQKGGINEVLVLMAQKNNQEAYDKVCQLDPTVPIHMYLRAACANRVYIMTQESAKFNEALNFIMEAVIADPHLEEIAKIDSDVLGLLDPEN